MDLTNLPAVLALIQTNGYWMMLLGTIIEGPVVTAAGAFAASLGLMNIFLVVLISFAGDIIGDSIYFSLGRWKGKQAVEKVRSKLGMSRKRVSALEERLNTYFLPSLFIIKMTPLLAPLGLTIIGSSKVSFKKYILSSLIIIIPASICYALLGFYTGLAADTFFKYFKIARELMLVLIVLIGFLAYLIEKKLLKRIAKTVSKASFSKFLRGLLSFLEIV